MIADGLMSGRSVGWSTGLWLLICASLAALVGLELAGGMSIAPQVTAAPPPAPLAETAPATQPFEAPPEDAFDEIVLRPLFFESRRPFVPPPADVAAAEAPAEALPVRELSEALGKVPNPKGAVLRAFRQAARELLLAQSSDWAFMMRTGSHKAYAEARFKIHLNRFERFLAQARSGKVDLKFLADVEDKDNLFPDIDLRPFKKS